MYLNMHQLSNKNAMRVTLSITEMEKQTWYNWIQLGRGNSLRTASIWSALGQVSGAFSWLPRPLWVGPAHWVQSPWACVSELNKEAGEAKEASKSAHSSMSASVPVRALNFCLQFSKRWCGGLSKNGPQGLTFEYLVLSWGLFGKIRRYALTGRNVSLGVSSEVPEDRCRYQCAFFLLVHECVLSVAAPGPSLPCLLPFAMRVMES